MISGATSKMAQPAVTDEVLYSGSDDEYYESPSERRRRCSTQRRRYEEGKPVTILTAQLKGPFSKESGWQNPWRSRHQPGRKDANKDAKTKNRVVDEVPSNGPDGESFIAPESIVRPKTAPLQPRAPALQRMSSSNILTESPQRRHTTPGQSSSLQLLDPVASSPRAIPINQWMKDETWSRVQTWRDTIKPEFGLWDDMADDRSPQPHRSGRKRPVTAEFLRKAFASSKRLKYTESEYSTPASPSPVKETRPIRQPDSSGTFGPVLPSTPRTDRAQKGAPSSTSVRQDVSVLVPSTKEAPTSRDPLVDYSSSYNTPPDNTATLVLTHRTPSKLAAARLGQIMGQQAATGSPRWLPRPTFEQLLLASPKVRLGASARNPTTPRHEPGKSQTGILLNTPHVSPHAVISPRGPATGNAKPERLSPAASTAMQRAAVAKAREEQELEFQSQADQSFHFHVKVRQAGRRKDAPKPITGRSRTGSVPRAAIDIPASTPAADARDKSAVAGHSRCTAIEDGASEGEATASSSSQSDELTATSDQPPARKVAAEEAVEAEVTQDNAIDVAIEANVMVEHLEDTAVDANLGNGVEAADFIESRSVQEALTEGTGVTGSCTSGTASISIATDTLAPPEEEIEPTPQAAVRREGCAAIGEDAAGPEPMLPSSSSDKEADMGQQAMTASDSMQIPFLATLDQIRLSPLHFSFFGNSEDVVPGTERGKPGNGDGTVQSSFSKLIKVGREPETLFTLSDCVLARGGTTNPRPAGGDDASKGVEAGSDGGEHYVVEVRTPTPAREDSVGMATQRQRGIKSSPDPAVDPSRSPQTPTLQPSSPWSNDMAADGSQQDELEQIQTPVPHSIESLAMHSHTHVPTRTPRPASADDSVQPAPPRPSQQSPWAGSDLALITAPVQEMGDTRLSSTQRHVRPIGASQSQNPWKEVIISTPTHQARLHASDQPSSPASLASVTGVALPELPMQTVTEDDSAMPDAPVGQLPPSTPTKQSSLPTPDFTISIRSFRAFATPSPERPRAPSWLLGTEDRGRVKSILKPPRTQDSDNNKSKATNPMRKVVFDLELRGSPSPSPFSDETTIGAELPTREATRSPPRRRGRERACSPPVQLSQSDAQATRGLFSNHFAHMVRKAEQAPRHAPVGTPANCHTELLPSASQQVCGTPGFDAMAEAFIQADQLGGDTHGDVTMEGDDDDNNWEDVVDGRSMDFEMSLRGEEEWSQHDLARDPVAHVLNNLDTFIGAYDVEAELRKFGAEMEAAPRRAYSSDVGGDDMTELMGQGIWE